MCPHLVPVAFTCGIPQGFILGPLLFLTYVNDLNNALNISNFILFADDTTILLKGKVYNKLMEETNKEIEKSYKWFC